MLQGKIFMSIKIRNIKNQMKRIISIEKNILDIDEIIESKYPFGEFYLKKGLSNSIPKTKRN